ncbi:MAG: GatB/YqeY domain-containing protein [Deltaproteobacteria bacterium]|nr:GatB/YqeY domain-containing protein [Deltaproteobacteria bacterium]
MSLEKKIVEDLKKAMKEKDATRLSCLRMLKTALKNLQVEKRRELIDPEIEAVISSLIKKGKESVAEFRKAGREDLALKEESEVAVFYGYMPEQLTPENIEKTIKEIILELSAEKPSDLGKVMKTAMSKMAGKAQGKEVNEIAKRLLA